MERTRVLTVQDISCVGRCSMTVALPVLAACGVEACPLPTAVFSTHTGGFGVPHVADLTSDMLPIAEHWRCAGLKFDVISCGYLCSAQQMSGAEYIFDTLAAEDCIKIIDPAMADHGTLYAGFDNDFVAEMKRFCTRADWLLPNITEACLLTDTPYRENYDRIWVERLTERLSAKGYGNILITGVSIEQGTTGVMVNGEYISHCRLPQNCHGTGDLFAAVFAGALARGKRGADAAQIAAWFTLSCMEYTFAENDMPYGIVFEPLLGQLVSQLQG